MLNKTYLLQFCLMLVCGIIGGISAWLLGLPLPFMLGSLVSTMLLVMLANRRGIKLHIPRIMRMVFIGVIGTMIGSTFSPDILKRLPDFAITLSVLVVYVVVAHTLGYLICRYIGRYDKVTAFYSAMPGGLVEAVALGEQGGGDVKALTLSHFLRLCLVVVLVPTFFYFYLGSAVGSAAGQSFASGRPADWTDVLIISGITGTGLAAARYLHIPAGHLIGPMLLSVLVFGSGLATSANPIWLLWLAQLIVGIGVGSQISGASATGFKRILAASLLMVATYLGLSFVIALLIRHFTGFDFAAVFLSFAPGGVTEMGLIALSLSLSPVLVSAHHVCRIFLTVFVAALSTRWMKRSRLQDTQKAKH